MNWHARCRTEGLPRPAFAAHLMSHPPPDKVQDAIRDCVASCQRATEPLTCIAEFVGELRNDPTWSEAEIVQVQTTATRVLARLLRGDD